MRIDQENYLYLVKMENYSEYIRSLIDQDRIKKQSESYIKSKIKFHESEIDKLKNELKTSKEDSEEIIKILEIAKNHYNQISQDPGYELNNFKFYIRSNILPKLKKARCNRYDIDQIIEICKGGSNGA